MKKYLFISILALLLAGCWGESKHKVYKEPQNSVAKEATWDLFLIGSWSYSEEGSPYQSEYPQGTESFYGNGDYVCYAENAQGQKVVLEGTWKLDNKEDFVVRVTLTKAENENGPVELEKKKFKYIINSLAPEETLIYQLGKVYRTATWEESEK